MKCGSTARPKPSFRPSGVYIDKNDTTVVMDSEPRDGRASIGRLAMAATGYGSMPAPRAAYASAASER
jgi:hypothetical protein